MSANILACKNQELYGKKSINLVYETVTDRCFTNSSYCVLAYLLWHDSFARHIWELIN